MTVCSALGYDTWLLTGFFKKEIAFRRAMQYPPFCDIVQIGLSGADEVALAAVREVLEANA